MDENNIDEMKNGTEDDKKRRRAMAERRLRIHRIRIATTVAGILAVLAFIFFVFIAHYDFSKKAWIVKWDPIHGYSYTMYSKQEFSHARIVINTCSEKSESVTVPDTIWGVRVEELADHSFHDKVSTVKLGKYVYLVGEGFESKTLILPSGYESASNYISIKDKEASGFYYKVRKDSTALAFAYFGTEEAYHIPGSVSGLKVSSCTEYYVNDGYLSLLAENYATHESTVPFNMLRVKQVQQNGINPYMRYLTNEDSRDKTKNRIYKLPDNYQFLPDGSPADGETAIKMALMNNGDGKGNNCALVMAKYPPLDFIAAVSYISKYTDDCHEANELNLFDWMQDGFLAVE